MNEEHNNKLFNMIWHNWTDKQFKDAKLLALKRLRLNGYNDMKNLSVLDIGCGNGRFTEALFELGADAVGIDIAEKSIQEAKKTGKAIYKTGNIYNISFKDKYFDIVILNGVLHHLKDMKKGLKECYRVLKNNGTLWVYAEVPYPDAFFDIKDKMKSIPMRNTFMFFVANRMPTNHIMTLMDIFYAQYSDISKEDMIKLITECGFNNSQKMKLLSNDKSFRYFFKKTQRDR